MLTTNINPRLVGTRRLIIKIPGIPLCCFTTNHVPLSPKVTFKKPSLKAKELGSFEYELLFSLLGTCSKHCSFLHYNLVSINQLHNEAGKQNEVPFGNTFIFDVIPVFSGSQSKHHVLVWRPGVQFLPLTLRLVHTWDLTKSLPYFCLFSWRTLIFSVPSISFLVTASNPF